MEMTIENSIEYLTVIKKSYLGDLSEHLSIAIEVMRKYQKITEIVEEWDKDLIDYEGHYGDDYMEKIQEVLEDGKID